MRLNLKASGPQYLDEFFTALILVEKYWTLLLKQP
jgi:hypothetical protein